MSELAPEQAEAARLAWAVGAELVRGGASAVGEVQEADLLRAVHACRATGLHRLGTAGVKIAASVRALRRDRPEFALATFTADLREWLTVARALGGAGDPPAETLAPFVGTARRAYASVGELVLHALFTEPIIARSGYAGVVTTFADGDGRLYSLGDVQPGSPMMAVYAYDGVPRLAGLRVSHRRLSRQRMRVHNATASEDLRLGAGAAVVAETTGPSPWNEGPAGALFDATSPAQRPGDVVFLRARVRGAHADALVVETSSGDVALVPPSDHAELAFRDNLQLLAGAPGLALRVVGRPVAGRRRTLQVIAVGGDEAPRLALPSDWLGRVNLGLDRLKPHHVPGGGTPVEVDREVELDPTEPVRRRIERMALGGRATLPVDANDRVEREARALEGEQMPTGARVLRGLAIAAQQRDPHALALAWLAAATWERAAVRSLW